MPPERFEATYLIETPLDPAKVGEIMAGEQSCGTFTRVQGETDALRERARAVVEAVEELAPADVASLPSAWLSRKGTKGPWRSDRLAPRQPLASGDVPRALSAAVPRYRRHAPPYECCKWPTHWLDHQ